MPTRHTNRTETYRYQQLRDRYYQACRDNNTPCWLCGQPINYDAPRNGTNPDAFQLDHYLPWSTHPEAREDPGNFRPSHTNCNNQRGNKTPDPPIGKPSRNWLTPNPNTKKG